MHTHAWITQPATLTIHIFMTTHEFVDHIWLTEEWPGWQRPAEVWGAMPPRFDTMPHFGHHVQICSYPLIVESPYPHAAAINMVVMVAINIEVTFRWCGVQWSIMHMVLPTTLAMHVVDQLPCHWWCGLIKGRQALT